TPTVIPLAQDRDLLGELRLERIGRSSIVPRLDQWWNHDRERRQIAVVRGCTQRLDREILPVGQNADRMQPACRLDSDVDVAREVLLPGAVRTCCGPRPVVAVVQPAVLWIQ